MTEHGVLFNQDCCPAVVVVSGITGDRSRGDWSGGQWPEGPPVRVQARPVLRDQLGTRDPRQLTLFFPRQGDGKSKGRSFHATEVQPVDLCIVKQQIKERARAQQITTFPGTHPPPGSCSSSWVTIKMPCSRVLQGPPAPWCTC